MRTALLLLSLLITNAGWMEDQVQLSSQQVESTVLRVSIVPNKIRYRPDDDLDLRVVVENLQWTEVYLFGNVPNSVHLRVIDASGKQIPPAGIFHSARVELPLTASRFVRLEHRHSLGSQFVLPLRELNMRRPGRYGLSVEYQSPVLEKDAPVKPFWGRERGPIKSDVVWVEVRR